MPAKQRTRSSYILILPRSPTLAKTGMGVIVGYYDWSYAMTTKEKMLRAVEELPDNATVEDAMERFLFLAKVERGLQQAGAGKTITQMEVRERMEKWLK